MGAKVWTGIKLVVGLIFGWIVFSCTTAMTDSGVVEKLAALPPAPAIAQPAPPPKGWQYQNSSDPLTGKPEAYATLVSDNQLSLDSPYRGRNYGKLTIRQSPRFGLNVYFEIEQGQLICGYSTDECAVRVAFDGKAPQRFGMVKPADSSSTILFFADERRFIKAALAATEIRLAAVVYQAGEPTLTFKAAPPLIWPSAK